MQPRCAIWTAAASAATTRTATKGHAQASITTARSTASCSASRRPASRPLYHYLLGREAPYPWYDLPVVLGTIGGIGLVVGPIGLLVAKSRRTPILTEERRLGMDVALHRDAAADRLTGLLLLVLPQHRAMNLLLALHLGVVFALFVTLPYGKFVHGIYRFAALVRYAKEQRAHAH